ncbi:hypothetical protein V3331_14465 [Gaopeijia maritima]|uniref:hypothetical protein n=1 Tax=Gaopeijia maritima TaxID=3119007 RepID=UPI003250D2E1
MNRTREEDSPDRDTDPHAPDDHPEPEPSKGAGRKSNVQRAPEDQRGRPDPKQSED